MTDSCSGHQGRATVLIADDHDEMRASIESLVASHYDVIGTAKNGQEALDQLRICRADIVLLDVSMPVMGGFAAAKCIKVSFPDVIIVFVSQHLDRRYTEQAFSVGGSGYVLKQRLATDLIKAINTAIEGGSFISP